jgi:hypothetical protein
MPFPNERNDTYALRENRESRINTEGLYKYKFFHYVRFTFYAGQEPFPGNEQAIAFFPASSVNSLIFLKTFFWD